MKGFFGLVTPIVLIFKTLFPILLHLVSLLQSRSIRSSLRKTNNMNKAYLFVHSLVWLLCLFFTPLFFCLFLSSFVCPFVCLFLFVYSLFFLSGCSFVALLMSLFIVSFVHFLSHLFIVLFIGAFLWSINCLFVQSFVC